MNREDCPDRETCARMGGICECAEAEPELTVRQQAARDVREMWNIAFGCDPS